LIESVPGKDRFVYHAVGRHEKNLRWRNYMHRSRSFDKPRVFDFTRPELVQCAPALAGAEGLKLHYALDDAQINRQLGSLLPQDLADLLDISVAAHIADRLAVRDHRTGWHRRLRLVIPVRCAALWQRKAISEALRDILEFLTEDEWVLEFSARSPEHARVAESQACLFPADFPGLVQVCLFSGGLDSFVGSAAAMAQSPNAHFIFVSGVANTWQNNRQQEQIGILKQLPAASVTHLRVGCWVKRADEVSQEPTRRTRGFLFLALGAIAALVAKQNDVFLFENGIGAINLPFSTGEIGVPTSRSVHPHTLGLMQRLISLIAERAFTIHNPCLFRTKARMCRDMKLGSVLAAIPRTFSCDAFPLRRAGASQCGVCTSCLLRRLSLYQAGAGDETSTDYRYDVYQRGLVLDQRHRRGLGEMDWQVARLRAALGAPDPWGMLIHAFPDLLIARDALTNQGSDFAVTCDALLELYRHHCEEWVEFREQQLLQRKAA
jgi:7-cyano-7-deazaguanine synthase in queuosine biosynthesis